MDHYQRRLREGLKARFADYKESKPEIAEASGIILPIVRDACKSRNAVFAQDIGDLLFPLVREQNPTEATRNLIDIVRCQGDKYGIQRISLGTALRRYLRECDEIRYENPYGGEVNPIWLTSKVLYVEEDRLKKWVDECFRPVKIQAAYFQRPPRSRCKNLP